MTFEYVDCHIRITDLKWLLKFMKHLYKITCLQSGDVGFLQFIYHLQVVVGNISSVLETLCNVIKWLDHVRFSGKLSPALLLFITWSWLSVDFLGFCLLFCVSLALTFQEI